MNAQVETLKTVVSNHEQTGLSNNHKMSIKVLNEVGVQTFEEISFEILKDNQV